VAILFGHSYKARMTVLTQGSGGLRNYINAVPFSGVDILNQFAKFLAWFEEGGSEREFDKVRNWRGFRDSGSPPTSAALTAASMAAAERPAVVAADGLVGSICSSSDVGGVSEQARSLSFYEG
jgi:hypothetical protein